MPIEEKDFVFVSNQWNYLRTVKSNNHPQFTYDDKKDQVYCRCGEKAAILRNAYVCSSFTVPNNCQYQRMKLDN